MKIGQKHSEESKQKMSLVKKGLYDGNKAPFFGKHHSDETKKKISNLRKCQWSNPLYRQHQSEIHKGRRHSQESINKMKKIHTGRKHSEMTKWKIGQSNIGKHTGRTGKYWSDEIKRKISESHKGQKNPCWKGGITPLKGRIRHTHQYNHWRQKVFIKDDFTCQKCRKRGGYLEAHHIRKFAILLSEAWEYMPLLSKYDAAMLYTPLWDINNGTTLCIKCHKKTQQRRQG